ncbi:hypothetical protein HMPREF9555_00181 [Selenomonas artemidis F0399]|uniref:Uncharacterized protein n=1 Tax=Selenomonas artemidis F0399 TaxID=749551 RepID=E7MZN9_9FIRM|nr:hypothetical protein HMPREF9555_00181 [Selenomonas artemidis F0399]
MSDTGIGKETVNILDTAARVVEIYLAFPAAIKTAFDDNFLIINGECLIPIVKDEHDFRDAECTPRGGTCKDNIFGAKPAQHSDILFAKNPTNGIRNIAFAAAVRPYNRRNAAVKFHDDAVGKGLESVRFQAF